MENMVMIPIERLETLLDIETRVDILISLIDAGKYLSDSDFYRILGYEKKAKEADNEKVTISDEN